MEYKYFSPRSTIIKKGCDDNDHHKEKMRWDKNDDGGDTDEDDNDGEDADDESDADEDNNDVHSRKHASILLFNFYERIW